MDIKVTVPKVNFGRLAQTTIRAAVEESRELARQTVELNTVRILQGLGPDGSPQRPNPPGVAARKGGKPPLVDTGLLSRASSWRVAQEGSLFIITPPAARARIIDELRERGYKLFEIPVDTRREAQRSVQRLKQQARLEVKK